jgi:hypothetical protein
MSFIGESRKMQIARQIKKDIKNHLKVAKKIRLRWRESLCVFIGSLLICWLFDHFERFDLARPALFLVLAIAFTIAIERSVRRHLWFWVTLSIMVLLHIVLILCISWTTRWVPAAVSAGICTAAIFVMLAILDSVETLAERREKRASLQLR